MIRINPALKAGDLAKEFETRRRMQVRDFLVPEDAERVHDMLANQTPWWTAFNVGERVEQVSPEQAARLTPQQLNQMLLGINERAKTGYQFIYNFYPMTPTYFDPAAPKLPILEVLEFVNSPKVLDFVRALTGCSDISGADAQATLYRAGHFLKSHSDEEPGGANKRVAAYVMNFTKLWERDWGGYLQFYNERHDIEEAYRPIFNALNIFTVPADHAVGMVSSFAYGMRFSVTGWFRTDAPPGRLDLFGEKEEGGA